MSRIDARISGNLRRRRDNGVTVRAAGACLCQDHFFLNRTGTIALAAGITDLRPRGPLCQARPQSTTRPPQCQTIDMPPRLVVGRRLLVLRKSIFKLADRRSAGVAEIGIQ
jgi:hypothetical protein